MINNEIDMISSKFKIYLTTLKVFIVKPMENMGKCVQERTE